MLELTRADRQSRDYERIVQKAKVDAGQLPKDYLDELSEELHNAGSTQTELTVFEKSLRRSK